MDVQRATSEHPAYTYQLERRVNVLRRALETIAQGRPDDVTPEAWGEWCEVWAKDELNADEVNRGR